jgi:NTE family protein
MSTQEMRQAFKQLSWWKLMRPVLPFKGLVSFEPIEEWFVHQFGDLVFSELHPEFAAATTDLRTGESVVLREGRLAPAVRASCSVPGFITPVEIEGRLLGDGSLSNSVPVSMVREMGADYVIAVDIFSPIIHQSLGALGYGLGALEILVQRSGGGIASADCLITPRLAGKPLLRFSAGEQLYQLGIAAAEEKLEEVQTALASTEDIRP